MKYIFILIIIIPLYSYTQIESPNYYLILQKAEKFIVSENLDSSLYYYEKAFKEYNFPFGKDILTAACVAHYANDTSRLYKYISILLNRGMLKSELEYFHQRRPNDKNIDYYITNYHSYNEIYLSSIDKSLEKKFRELDKRNQIDITFAQQNYKPFSKDYKIQRRKDNIILVDEYVRLIQKYGFPTEEKVGLGSRISLMFSNDKKTIFFKDYKYELITEPDIRIKNNDSVFFEYSYITNTTLVKYYTRRGNSFLWHIDFEDYPEIDSILLVGINETKVSPLFYAACKERSGVGINKKFDYCIAWESKANQKYDFNLKKIIESPEAKQINKHRESVYIRTLEDDLELFEALQKLENLKYKHYFKRKSKGKNLFFNSLFTSTMP